MQANTEQKVIDALRAENERLRHKAAFLSRQNEVLFNCWRNEEARRTEVTKKLLDRVKELEQHLNPRE